MWSHVCKRLEIFANLIQTLTSEARLHNSKACGIQERSSSGGCGGRSPTSTFIFSAGWIKCFSEMYSESHGLFFKFIWALLNVCLLKITSLALLVRNNFFCSLVIRLCCIFIILNVTKQTEYCSFECNIPCTVRWEIYVSIYLHNEWDMIMGTDFLSILNQMEFHLVQNRK